MESIGRWVAGALGNQDQVGTPSRDSHKHPGRENHKTGTGLRTQRRGGKKTPNTVLCNMMYVWSFSENLSLASPVSGSIDFFFGHSPEAPLFLWWVLPNFEKWASQWWQFSLQPYPQTHTVHNNKTTMEATSLCISSTAILIIMALVVTRS